MFDERERFHLFALLFVVVVQTMKEYGWREDSFWSLAPDCLLVLGAEILVDWIKHAFIIRVSEVPADVNNTISLAYDLAQTKQKYAFLRPFLHYIEEDGVYTPAPGGSDAEGGVLLGAEHQPWCLGRGGDGLLLSSDTQDLGGQS